MNQKIEIGFVLILFLSAFYLWTLPFQENPIPFGDVDSSTHFGLGDYMAYKNKAIIDVPYFFSFRYGKNNAGKLWYPPQYHTNIAIFELFGGSREISTQIYIAMASFTVVFTTYLLMRNLFGFFPAVITSTLMLFSRRDILWYVLGQYPQVISFGLVPLFLLSIYKSLISFKEQKKLPLYLYLASIILALQFFFHPQAIFVSGLSTFFFVIFFFLKEKKIPFSLKHISISLVVIFILIAPFYRFPFGKESIYKNPLATALSQEKPYNRLFHWYGRENPEGISPSYYSFSKMHGGIWLIPFIIMGLCLLLWKRKTSHLLLLSMFLTLYIAMHSNVFALGRAERFMEIEAMILYPIATIGFFGLLSLSSSFFRFDKKTNETVKYILLILIVLTASFTIGKESYNLLKDSYAGYNRMTPPQYEAANWMKENLPENADVYLVGTAIYTKRKWFQAISFRHMVTGTNLFPDFPLSDADHVLLDYSEINLLGDQQAADALNEWVIQNLQNAPLLYDKGNIRVFDIEKRN